MSVLFKDEWQNVLGLNSCCIANAVWRVVLICCAYNLAILILYFHSIGWDYSTLVF